MEGIYRLKDILHEKERTEDDLDDDDDETPVAGDDIEKKSVNVTQSKAAMKKVLEKTEEDVFGGRTRKPLKAKQSDGTIVDLTDPKRPRTQCFEEQILDRLPKRPPPIDEKAVGTAMEDYFAKECIDADKFIQLGNIKDDDDDTKVKLNAVGLETLLNMYCTIGNNCKAGSFKEDLKNDLKINGLHVHQIFRTLETLRHAAVSSAISAPVSTPSVGSNSGRISSDSISVTASPNIDSTAMELLGLSDIEMNTPTSF
jgi:hypothetical protein